MSKLPTAVMWFRRDLRLHDHPALDAALHGYQQVVCLYVLDDRLLAGRGASLKRNWFLHESLTALAAAITAKGGTFVTRRGLPEAEVPAVALEFEAEAVFVSRDYGPFGRARDEKVAAALGRDGIRFIAMPGILAVEPEDVVKDGGGGFAVFGAFFRRWQLVGPRPVLPAPQGIPGPLLVRQIPPPDGFAPARPNTALLPAGEAAARRRMDAWVTGPLEGYAADRDRLDIEGTSRLSQDLRWGLVSALEVLRRVAVIGAAKFEQELAWRDFYHHLAWHAPRVIREPFRNDFARLPWHDDPGALASWQEGRTGFPVVDAAMRQLVATGWMHNRARMIVASFLTKHLLIDYRQGERWFMAQLLDGDVAVNNGGWQWASSTGTDPQPYFRVFNPVLQGQRFDPTASFVRRWLPELGAVPLKFVHQPWSMPEEMQRSVGCVIGRDYPAPVVPQAGAAARARDFYSAARRVK